MRFFRWLAAFMTERQALFDALDEAYRSAAHDRRLLDASVQELADTRRQLDSMRALAKDALHVLGWDDMYRDIQQLPTRRT